MRSVSAHLDGLDTEIGGIETSPGDLMTDFTAPNASYFHVDMTPLRLAMNRPAPAGAATGRRSSDTFTPVPALTPAVKSAAGPAASRPRPPSGSTSKSDAGARHGGTRAWGLHPLLSALARGHRSLIAS